MQGRLEHTIKTENNIDKILLELPEVISEYYLNLSAKREPKSCLEYLRKIRNFLKFIDENNIKDINFNNIKDTDILRYMKSLETTIKNGETVETSFSYRKQNHTILNSLFTYLYKKEYINKNPMLLIERETGKDKPNRKFLTEKELKKILKSVNNGAGSERMVHRQEKWKSRDLVIFMLFMQTGMRETALTEININDIDFENKTLSIIDKGHEKHYYILDDEVLLCIRNWIHDREVLMCGKENDALLISSTRERISATSISNIVKKYSEEAIGYSISPHKLRAAYCNLLLRRTGNLHLVSKLVGHKRPDTTEIYYVKFFIM